MVRDQTLQWQAMPRLFIAITPPQAVCQHLSLLCHGLPEARWMETFHLTVRFIGEVDGASALDIEAALHDVDLTAFSLTLSGTGHFPPRGAAKVLWAGLMPPTDPLVRLKHRLDTVLEGVGVGPDPRHFAPHITLARLRGTPDRRVAQWLAHSAGFLSTRFAVTHFELFSSTLTGDGARHRLIARYPLKVATQ